LAHHFNRLSYPQSRISDPVQFQGLTGGMEKVPHPAGSGLEIIHDEGFDPALPAAADIPLGRGIRSRIAWPFQLQGRIWCSGGIYRQYERYIQ
jgi:hypothetical protein